VDEKYKIEPGTDLGQLREGIFSLHNLAKLIKERRNLLGYLSFSRDKVKFELDENFCPLDYSVDVRKDANFMVEEFMLLANMAVAKKLVQTCQEVALIRKHPPPRVEKQEFIQNIVKPYNELIDFTSQKTLSESLCSI